MLNLPISSSYASFFYVAFIAEYLDDCPPDIGCMRPLAINLAIIFGTRLAVGNLFELIIPYFSYRYNYVKELKKHEGAITRPEIEFMRTK